MWQWEVAMVLPLENRLYPTGQALLGYSLALRKWAVVSKWEVDKKGKLETSQCGVEHDSRDGEGEMQWLFPDPNALYLKAIWQLLM